MIHHIGDALLSRFTRGDLDPQVAVAVARHIDGCPRCACRAATSEPMAQAFAAVEDPRTPLGLPDEILTALSERQLPGVATAEMAVAAVLLGAAVLVLALGGDPAGLAAEAASALLAMGAALRVLLSQIELAPAWWSTAAATVVFVSCLLIANRLGAWSRGPSRGAR